MASERPHLLVRFTRSVLVALAAILVAWSFYRVVTRPRTSAPATGQTLITVVHWGEKNEDRIVASLVEDFQNQPENADVRVLRINLGQAAAVKTKLQTMFAAGEPPDVFYLDYDLVATLGSKGLLADIEALIAADREAGRPTIDLNDMFKSVVDAFRYDAATQRIGRGKLIGLAKDFTTVGFYYNRDLFRRAGVPEPSPQGWTWDEFHAAAQAIGRLPGCYGADFVTWEAMVRIWLWTHGVDFFEPGFDPLRFTDPEVIAALTRLQDWFHREDRTLVSAKTQLETGLEPFLSGNIGLAGPFGRWKVPIYRTIDSFDWEFAPLPHAAGKPPRNGVFTVAWAIAERSRRKDAAWRFVKYLSSPRGQARMSEEGLAIPVLRSVAESPSFANPGRKPENYRVYLDAAEWAQPIDWPAEPKYLHQLRVRLEDIFKLNQPVAPAMTQVEREWRAARAAAAAAGARPRMPWMTVALAIGAPLFIAATVLAWRWWRRRPGQLALREELAGMAMIGPWVIGFAAFTAFPVVLSLLLAFTRWSGLLTLDHAEFVGFENFYRLFTQDQAFRRALYVTALYALLAVPTGQAAALLAAILVSPEVRGIGVFRAIWYLPSVLAGVGMAVMWKWVFHHEYGLLNALLQPLADLWSMVAGALTGLGEAARISPPHWFEKDAETWGVPAFAIVNLWTIGGTMMIYLAGLKGIPRDLHEAAAIDGATGWRRFVNVTLPMLSPVIFFNLIIAIIASFQIFTQAYVMTAGGPGEATMFYVVYLYNQAFNFHEMGYASAMAWMLLLIVLALTLLVMRSSRRFVYYEALKA